MNRLFQLLACLLLLAGNNLRSHAAETRAELTNLAINGGIQDGKARLILEANLRGSGDPTAPVLYATALDHAITVSAQRIQHSATATFDLLQGQPDELILTLAGPGEIQSVTGEALLDWSVRRETNGLRSLVLRPRKSDKPLPRLSANIVAADVRRQDSPSSPSASVAADVRRQSPSPYSPSPRSIPPSPTVTSGSPPIPTSTSRPPTPSDSSRSIPASYPNPSAPRRSPAVPPRSPSASRVRPTRSQPSSNRPIPTPVASSCETSN